MTWVIAGKVFYPFMAADIRMKFTGSDEPHDRLMKIYPITPNIVGAFSGSVEIGLDTLRMIRVALGALRPDRQLAISLPLFTYKGSKLPRLLRRCFKAHSDEAQDHGCDYLFMSAHPRFNCGPPLPIPQYDVFKFNSPDFEPKKLFGDGFFAIGSGNEVEVYREDLSYYVRQPPFRGAAMTGPDSLAAVMLAGRLAQLVRDTPHGTVSPLFSACSVRVTGHAIWLYPPPDPKLRLISSRQELDEYCSSRGLSAATAVAG